MKDWELLRDELAAAEEEMNRKDHVDGGLASMMEGDFNRSSLRNDNSEEALANSIEIHQLYYIDDGLLTKEMVKKYSDFFDRTGLETDLDKIVAEDEAKHKWRESYVETVPPPYPADQRKELCRHYRRSVGWQLKEMRNKRGYTLREVEEATGIAKNIISRTEAGRANTTIDTLAVLTDFYGMGPVQMTKMSGLPTIDEIG